MWLLIFLPIVLCKNLEIDLSILGERAIGLPSRATGELVDKWSPEDGVNPEELGEYSEGDILFAPSQLRNGLSASTARWPNGIIPFEIKGSFNAFEMNIIEEAINEYHKSTCVRFVPRTGREKAYVRIVNDKSGCWSSVGRTGEVQEVNLQTPACVRQKGTVMHELMHVTGFLHEQNRENRDNHVNIVWGNIKKGHEHNFNKAPTKSTNDFGVPYDYGSIMHYSSKAFSVNGGPTIVPKVNTDNVIGQRQSFSDKDIQKINLMYNCK